MLSKNEGLEFFGILSLLLYWIFHIIETIVGGIGFVMSISMITLFLGQVKMNDKNHELSQNCIEVNKFVLIASNVASNKLCISVNFIQNTC